jgi:hypothetical protein
MLPKSKLQRRVVELSEATYKNVYIPYTHVKGGPESEDNGYMTRGLNDEQKEWAFTNCLEHKATRLKSGKISCLDCGHQWNTGSKQAWHDQIVENKCPSCNTKLKIETTRKKNFHNYAHIWLVETVEEFQVFRLFKLNANYSAGKKATLNAWACAEIWSIPNGKFEIVGQNRGGMGYYMSDHWNGDYTLRNRNNIGKYLYSASVYPKRKVKSIYKRNGYNHSFHSVCPFIFLGLLLKENKFETLVKSKQFGLVTYCASDNKYLISRRWSMIKTAIKNNYKIKDPSLWFDHIDTLEDLNRDASNPKYLLPKNLIKEHNRLVEIKRNKDRKRAKQDIIEQIKSDEKFYSKHIKRFLDLVITDGNIVVEPYKTVREIKIESGDFGHCAFVSKYHRKSGSLMLSAKVNGVSVETVEFDLYAMSVNQSRGKGNNPSVHNKKIVALVNKNANLIKKAMKVKSKKKKLEFA